MSDHSNELEDLSVESWSRRMLLAAGAGAAVAMGAEEAAAQPAQRGATIDVRDFGAVGDGVADDTRAIQAAMNAAGRGRAVIGFNIAEVVFPPGVYRLTDRILLPFGSGKQSAVRPLHIVGHGAVLKGSGSTDDAHDCFVSARWTGEGETNEPTVQLRPQTSITMGVVLEGFTIGKFRRAFHLQNWNHGCAVRDVFCLSVQQALDMDMCFYCEFKNIKSRGTPDQDTKPNFEIQGQANIAPMFGLHSNGHAIGYRVSGTHALAMYDCSFESAQVGMLISGEVPQLTIFNGYFEGCRETAIRIDGVVRSMNVIGCFVNQEKAHFIQGPSKNGQYAHINFIGNRFHSGDMTLSSNLYGTYTGIAGNPEAPMPFRGNHKVLSLSPRLAVEQSRQGWAGPLRLVNAASAPGQPNPGYYGGGFGDQVPDNNRAPWQTVRATDVGGGTVWTFDTDIDFAENLFGSWLLHFESGGRTYRFHFMLMGGHDGQQVAVGLYAGNPMARDDRWFAASNHQGKVRLSSKVSLRQPRLVKSVLRVF